MADSTTDNSSSLATWLIGGGVLALGGLVVSAWAAPKVAPYALAYAAPELLPDYLEMAGAKSAAERQDKMLQLVGRAGGTRDPIDFVRRTAPKLAGMLARQGTRVTAEQAADIVALGPEPRQPSTAETGAPWEQYNQWHEQAEEILYGWVPIRKRLKT